jgi:hypothetical protein
VINTHAEYEQALHVQKLIEKGHWCTLTGGRPSLTTGYRGCVGGLWNHALGHTGVLAMCNQPEGFTVAARVLDFWSVPSMMRTNDHGQSGNDPAVCHTGKIEIVKRLTYAIEDYERQQRIAEEKAQKAAREAKELEARRAAKTERRWQWAKRLVGGGHEYKLGA